MIKSIPLNKLVQSPRNVRRHSDPAADAELKASISAHGLLQNLIVRPAAKGKFEVEAGERRRRSMLALADDKILARDHEVTCLVLEDSAEAAVETSLAENFHRLAMNPADEAQAFAALVAGGATVEDVACRFGLTVRFVEGRLRLATLAPVVFEALASGQITLDIAKAFGATSDQEIQARVFEQVSSAYYAPNADSIRRMVLSGTVRGSDPRARLVGRDAYIAAGGRIERELFDNDDSESWVDVALLESLAATKMEEQAKALAAEQGLAWVKPTLDPYASHDLVEGLVRLPADPAPLVAPDIEAVPRDDAFGSGTELEPEPGFRQTRADLAPVDQDLGALVAHHVARQTDIALFFEELVGELPSALERVLGNQVHDVKPRWAKGTAHRVARLLADHIDELERKDALLGEGSASFGGRHG